MRKFALLWVLTVLILHAVGCSGRSPMEPSALGGTDSVLTTTGMSYGNSHQNWGYWDVTIDPDTLTVDANPLRNSTFTANVTQFMQPPMSPVEMVSFIIKPGSDPDNGFFIVDITFNHPFPGLNKYNGFDVRGIFMSFGTLSSEHDATAIRATAGETHLVNPDGYSRWWNPVEFTSYNKIFGFTPGSLAPPLNPDSTLNPYKLFADSLDETSHSASMDPASRGIFTASKGSNTRQYEIQFKQTVGGQNVFDFQYAIDASWEDPDPNFAPDFPPEAFPLAANAQEAWALAVDDSASTAFYKQNGEQGGDLVLDIEIFDWQSPDNPLGVKGEISGIFLEGPVLNSVESILDSATVLPGSTSVSSVFQTTITNLNLTKSGIESIFVTVESASPSTYEPQVDGGDFFDFPDSALAAYFSFDVTILDDGGVFGNPATVTDTCKKFGYTEFFTMDISIYGADFDPAAVVEIKQGSGIPIPGQNVVWVDANTLIADFDLTGADTGYYDVRVTNPASSVAVLEDGFDVLDLTEVENSTTEQGDRANTGYRGVYGPCEIHNAPTDNVPFPPIGAGFVAPTYVTGNKAFACTLGNTSIYPDPAPAVSIDLDTLSIDWDEILNYLPVNYVFIKAMSEDGSVLIIFEKAMDRLVGVDASDGSEMWEITGVQVITDTYATLDLEGNFIVPITDVGIISVDPTTGVINWQSNIGAGAFYTPACGSNGVIYAFSNISGVGNLHALDPSTGAIKWTSENTGVSTMNGVTVHPNGTIIMPQNDGLWCFQDNGNTVETLWLQPSYSPPIYGSAGVDPDGYIYTCGGTVLLKIDPSDGSTVIQADNQGIGINFRPVFGKDGLMYTNIQMSNSESYLRCYNPDLSVRWEYDTEGPGGYGLTSPPSIGLEGNLYSTFRPDGLVIWAD